MTIGSTIKKAAYVTIAAGLFVTGVAIGHYSATDREYQIMRFDEAVFLRSVSLDRAYQLTRTQDEVYLGDSEHNLKGVRAVSYLEGKEAMQPQVEQLTNQVSELEGKIRARKVVDTVEDVGDNIGDGWRNFKHNLLDGN